MTDKMVSIYKRVVQRNKRTAERSKKVNHAASERLKRDLVSLENCSNRIQQQHSRKLQEIKDEINQLFEEKCYLEQKISLGRLSGCHLVASSSSLKAGSPSPRSASPVDRKYENYDLKLNRSAKLPGGRWYSESSEASQACHLKACKCFPCKRPTTYHSFGPQSIYQHWQKEKKSGEKTTIKLNTSQDELRKGQSRRMPDKQPDAFGLPLTPVPRAIPDCSYLGFPAPRTKIKAREEQLLSGTRGRNELKRPAAWCTNYGKPVSCRRLLKPVVAVSTD